MKKLIVSMLALTLAACGGSSSGPLPTNKQLTIAVTQEFESMNPIISQMAATTYIKYMATRPLVSIDPDWRYQCWLCVKIPSLENGLAKIVTEGGKRKVRAVWEIREDARWGDGTPLTGEDVKVSWEIGRSSNVSVGSKDVYERVERVEVDPKNPKRFTLTFTEARYAHYQLATFYIVPAHIEGPIFARTKDQQGAYEKQTAYTTDPLLPGLYSGPYLIKEIRLGSHVTLERNPEFHGPQAKIERIIVKLIPNTQTLEANLLSGNINMISEMGMTFDQALALEKRVAADPALSERHNVLFREGMTYEHVDFNLRDPLLRDSRVRRALAHGADLDKLVSALFEARQKKALHNVHPLDPYYTDDVPRYAYDPRKAEGLLADAGWLPGPDGIRLKGGQRLTLSMMTTAQNKTREQVQVFLQEEWRKIGVEVRIQNEPARVFFGETVRKGKYPHMAMYAWVSSPDNPPRSTVHTESIPSEANGWSGQNSGAWSNAKVDAALNAILTEFSFDRRKTLMKTVQSEYARELPVLPLYLRAEIASVPKNLKNFRLAGHQFYSTLNVEHWTLE